MNPNRPYLNEDRISNLEVLLNKKDLSHIRNLYKNNESKNALVSLLQKDQYKYFLTITFNTTVKESESDNNISHIIKIITKKIFGSKHVKKNEYLDAFITREMDAYKIRSHYHLIIKEHNKLTLEKLAKALIYASQVSSCLSELSDGDFDQITMRHDSSDESCTKKPNINIVEINTPTDLVKISKYVCKNLTVSPNAWMMTSYSTNGYNQIVTK